MPIEVKNGGLGPHANDILIKTGWSTEFPRAPWDTDPTDFNELPSATEPEALPAPTGQISEKEHTAPEEPEWTAWSSDPFALIQKPFGSYKEQNCAAESVYRITSVQWWIARRDQSVQDFLAQMQEDDDND